VAKSIVSIYWTLGLSRAVVGADFPHADVIAHDDQDFWILVLRRNRSDFAARVSIPSSS
jgi:predicted TIM-barrel fold metal-dependent hydrolase